MKNQKKPGVYKIRTNQKCKNCMCEKATQKVVVETNGQVKFAILCDNCTKEICQKFNIDYKKKNSNQKKIIISVIAIVIALIILFSVLISKDIIGKKISDDKLKKAIKSSYMITSGNDNIEYEPNIVNQMISQKVKIYVIEHDDNQAKLSVTAPDIPSIIADITNSDEYKNAGNKYDYLNNQVKLKINSEDCKMVNNEVTVNIENNEGEIKIEESEDYADAIYGGLISYMKNQTEEIGND